MSSIVQAHQPCADCGSSDALSINDSGSTYCHSCAKYTPPHQVKVKPAQAETTPKSLSDWEAVKVALSSTAPCSVSERGLSAATLSKFGVVVDGQKVLYPYYTPENELVAAKIRYPDKRFQTAGEFGKGVLFGQQAFTKGGKYLTLVEGEYDALSAFQLQGSKYPCVSIRNGAQSALKDCKAAYEWLDSFEQIIISFDADDVGRKAAAEVAELFSGKASIMKHADGFKDASDYLQRAAFDEWTNAFWRAETYVPDGIVRVVDLWDEVNKPLDKADALYPYKDMNEITYGIRQAEMVTVTAGSGLGKSQFLREVIWHVLQTTEQNVGCLFLEESVRKTALSLMSLHANKQLHLPTTQSTEEERKAAFDAVAKNDRLYLFDHFGSTDVDNIVSRVRYMAKGLDCKYVFLDHVSIVVSAQSNLDERKALDEIMTKLRMLVQETGISLFVVSHLKRPDKVGHEEGAATSLAQLRGSAAIAQLSDIVIGLERNGQAEDPVERNTTRVRVLKNRFSGETGQCGSLLFNKQTGRMTELDIEAAL